MRYKNKKYGVQRRKANNNANFHLIPNPKIVMTKLLFKLKKPDFLQFGGHCVHYLAKMNFLKKLGSVNFF